MTDTPSDCRARDKRIKWVMFVSRRRGQRIRSRRWREEVDAEVEGGLGAWRIVVHW